MVDKNYLRDRSRPPPRPWRASFSRALISEGAKHLVSRMDRERDDSYFSDHHVRTPLLVPVRVIDNDRGREGPLPHPDSPRIQQNHNLNERRCSVMPFNVLSLTFGISCVIIQREGDIDNASISTEDLLQIFVTKEINDVRNDADGKR